MDQVTFPGPPMLFHIRMNALFLTLTAIDFIMFTIAVDSTMNNGVGGMVLFATEVRRCCVPCTIHLSVCYSMLFSWQVR